MAEKRGRTWTFIGYPGDSLPEDYARVLSDEMHLCWAESPVHDADLNGDGSEKKRHIHFILTFDGNKSFEQIREITDALHCPIPQLCRNVRSMVRYMIHLDNPEKHQYKREDIKCHGGFEIEDYFGRSLTDNRNILKEILDFCRVNDITDFYKLVDIVLDMGNDDWVDIITCRNTLFLSVYLKSKGYRQKEDAAAMDREASRTNLRQRMQALGISSDDCHTGPHGSSADPQKECHTTEGEGKE